MYRATLIYDFPWWIWGNLRVFDGFDISRFARFLVVFNAVFMSAMINAYNCATYVGPIFNCVAPLVVL